MQGAGDAYRLSGKVIDRTGNPVAYATVRITQTNIAVPTDTDGYFELVLQEGTHKGSVSAIGYKASDFEIKLTGNASIDIVLDENSVMLDGVSVYGKSASKQLEEGAFSGSSRKHGAYVKLGN